MNLRRSVKISNCFSSRNDSPLLIGGLFILAVAAAVFVFVDNKIVVVVLDKDCNILLSGQILKGQVLQRELSTQHWSVSQFPILRSILFHLLIFSPSYY